MIYTHPDSPFNKGLLIAGTLKEGTVFINERRCIRKWVNERGFVDRNERVEFNDKQEMPQSVEKYSSPATLEAIKKYVKKRTLA